MGLDAHRSHTGSAAAMGNTKGLVQVEMADVGPIVSGPREPNLCIEICSVEISLPAVRMHDLADRSD